MEATYCVGNDVDVCRMFDQYLYKRSENVDLSLSIPQNNFQSNGYEMNDQTFHTPSFGDEEFDIPAINPQQQQAQQQQQNHHGHQNHGDQQQHYQPPMQSMQQMSQQNQQQDAMGMHDPTGGYQQPLYLSGPDHGMVNPSYHSPQSNYSMSQQQQQHNNQLLMIQQQQQQHQQMMMSHGQPPPGSMGGYGASPQHPQGRGNSPPAAPGQEHTTSDDSDDSTPHPAMIAPMKRPSPEPEITKAQKKPKVQKKKKKRDPNEPQKPVSAYALFFRDTQAAIKGQNPNASFGEVSKIVASMWDALDSEHKNVYKKKTEAAKKEYLKALAAYRASLVSKGAGEGDGMYGNYSNYTPNNPQYGGYNPQGRTVPSPPMSQAPTPPSNQQGGPMKKPQGMMGPGGPMNPGQQGPHQGMMQSPMGHMGMGHMQQQQHSSYMQQPHPSQHMPVSPQQQHHPHSPQQHVPVSPHMQHMSPQPMVSSSPPVSAPSPAIPTSVAQQQSMAAQVAAHQQQQAAAAAHHQAQAQAQQGQMGPGQRPNSCIRHGCPNPAITNPEWEDEYCSNECVVSHCRDVFTNWVVSNKNQSQNFSTVK